MRVPLPLNPNMLLEGLVPAECGCFKSAQLPVKLVYQVAPRPIDWSAAAPLSPRARGSGGGASEGTSGGSGAAAAAAAAVAAAAAAAAAASATPDANAGPSAMGAAFDAPHGSGGIGGGQPIPVPPPQRPSAAAQAAALPATCRTALAVSEVDPFALRCVVIYKKGDDLRQDQFVLQVRDGVRGHYRTAGCWWGRSPFRS